MLHWSCLLRNVSSGICLFVCMLLSTAAQAPETMQEVEDRLLENYSRNSNPALASSQKAGKLLVHTPTTALRHASPSGFNGANLVTFSRDHSHTHSSHTHFTQGTCGDHPKANKIEVQIYVHRLSHINQKEGTFEMEGYFRMWWNDSRLRFNGTKDGGCEVSLFPNESIPYCRPCGNESIG